MAIVCEELWQSRPTVESENPRITLIYLARGTTSDLEAKAAVLATTPATYDGLVVKSYGVDRCGPEEWFGKVVYGLRAPPSEGDSVYQFETGGGTQHITQSLKTVGKYAPAGDVAPDYKGAIGVTKDSVEGVDITLPQYSFSERHYLAAASVTQAYRLTLFNLTGKVNLDPFRGFAKGEVQFLGSSGAKRDEDVWEVSFSFSASPNVNGLAVGDIQGISKEGWEYLWVAYADDEDAVAKKLIKEPIAAYVERVMEYGIFAQIGI